MKSLILVFFGGGLGSVLRFLITKYLSTNIVFPYSTFVVNVSGSLIIGVILGIAAKSMTITQSQMLFLATGFCGGFTTFSAFAYENYVLLKSGDFIPFALYTTASFAVGLLAVFMGIWLSRFF